MTMRLFALFPEMNIKKIQESILQFYRGAVDDIHPKLHGHDALPS
jgi:hypothetical protein